MKCDKLQQVENPIEWGLYYDKNEVDSAIDELKQEHHRERHEYIEMVAQIKSEINRKEAVGKRWFERCMEARAENVRLKRALWLARADRADDRARIFYFNDLETKLDIDGFSYDSKKKKGCKKLTARLWRIIWLKVESKCRAKSEEYK